MYVLTLGTEEIHLNPYNTQNLKIFLAYTVERIIF